MKNLKYSFKNKELLEEALTHRSYSAENKSGFDNQRLEFLGDAVVQIVVTDYLYKRYPNKPEGELTALRAALVKKASLAKIALFLELEKSILLGKGEAGTNGNGKESVLCDVLEALFGAIYLDSDIGTCKTILLELVMKLFPDPENIVKSLNPKGMLQEITQKEYSEKPKYSVKNQAGPEHNTVYSVEVSLKGKTLALGKGKSIKAAERNAAEKAIALFNKKN